MPIAITIILFLILAFVTFRFIKNDANKKNRKTSWLSHLNIGDKAIVEIPDDQHIFGKVTKIDTVYYTVEYKVKKEFIRPPFN